MRVVSRLFLSQVRQLLGARHSLMKCSGYAQGTKYSGLIGLASNQGLGSSDSCF